MMREIAGGTSRVGHAHTDRECRYLIWSDEAVIVELELPEDALQGPDATPATSVPL
jgi:hypothetical protein